MSDHVDTMMKGGFKQGLCGCLSSPWECALTCVFPFYAIAKNAEALGEKTGLSWIVAHMTCPLCAMALLRSKLRKHKGLPGNFCSDLAIACCCGMCAICQETAELGTMSELAGLLEGETPVTVQPKK